MRNVFAAAVLFLLAAVAPSAADPADVERLDGALAPVRSFKPTFMIRFSGCTFAFPNKPRRPAPRVVIVACARTSKTAAVCKVDEADYTEALAGSKHVFETVVTSDTASRLALASPRGFVKIVIDKKTEDNDDTVMIQREPDTTCKGGYLAAAGLEKLLKEHAKHEREEADDSSPQEDVRSTPAPRDSKKPDKPAVCKKKQSGEKCGLDHDCCSDFCKPSRTLKTCK